MKVYILNNKTARDMRIEGDIADVLTVLTPKNGNIESRGFILGSETFFVKDETDNILFIVCGVST